MAKVYVNSARAPEHPQAKALVEKQHVLFLQLAQQSTSHQVVDDPEAADIILIYVSFPFYFGNLDRTRRCVRQHPLRKRFPDRFFVYDPEDYAIPFVPGVYASIHRRWYDPSRQRPGPYIQYLWDHGEFMERLRPMDSAGLLFSFAGDRRTHPIREKVMRLSHPRARLEGGRSYTDAVGQWRRYREYYAECIHASKFVLCPRGRGTSSVRLFEVMRAGRVPVIIADDWVAPIGPDWDSFSIRVREGMVDEVPRILEERESEAAEWGNRARIAWTGWFSESVVFGRLIDACLDIQRSGFSRRSGGRPWLQWAASHSFWRPIWKRLGRGVSMSHGVDAGNAA